MDSDDQTCWCIACTSSNGARAQVLYNYTSCIQLWWTPCRQLWEEMWHHSLQKHPAQEILDRWYTPWNSEIQCLRTSTGLYFKGQNMRTIEGSGKTHPNKHWNSTKPSMAWRSLARSRRTPYMWKMLWVLWPYTPKPSQETPSYSGKRGRLQHRAKTHNQSQHRSLQLHRYQQRCKFDPSLMFWKSLERKTGRRVLAKHKPSKCNGNQGIFNLRDETLIA